MNPSCEECARSYGPHYSGECQHGAHNDYAANGYATRAAYLADLAQEYDAGKVYALAEMLGPSEDFDGLLIALEDDSSGC